MHKLVYFLLFKNISWRVKFIKKWLHYGLEFSPTHLFSFSLCLLSWIRTHTIPLSFKLGYFPTILFSLSLLHHFSSFSLCLLSWIHTRTPSLFLSQIFSFYSLSLTLFRRKGSKPSIQHNSFVSSYDEIFNHFQINFLCALHYGITYNCIRDRYSNLNMRDTKYHIKQPKNTWEGQHHCITKVQETIPKACRHWSADHETIYSSLEPLLKTYFNMLRTTQEQQ